MLIASPFPPKDAVEARFSGVTFTKELRCVAREYGRLQAEKGVGQPDERLDRFIIGACGLSSPKVTTMSWKMPVRESTSDEAVVASFGATTIFPAEMKGRPAGAWITRKNDQAILTLVSGTTDDAVTVTLADSSGRVIVQGTADGDIIAAKINRGHDGVARCELDPMAVRPAFRFTCTLAEGDPWAWIEVLTQHPSDHALVSSRALVIARRDLTTALQLTTTPPGADGDPERVILDGLNRVRQGAKLGAIEIVRTLESRRLQRPLIGSLIVTSDLERMTFPARYLAAGPVAVRVGVAPYRPERSPWGYYLVFIIALVPE